MKPSRRNDQDPKCPSVVRDTGAELIDPDMRDTRGFSLQVGSNLTVL